MIFSGGEDDTKNILGLLENIRIKFVEILLIRVFKEEFNSFQWFSTELKKLRVVVLSYCLKFCPGKVG